VNVQCWYWSPLTIKWTQNNLQGAIKTKLHSSNHEQKSFCVDFLFIMATSYSIDTFAVHRRAEPTCLPQPSRAIRKYFYLYVYMQKQWRPLTYGNNIEYIGCPKKYTHSLTAYNSHALFLVMRSVWNMVVISLSIEENAGIRLMLFDVHHLTYVHKHNIIVIQTVSTFFVTLCIWNIIK
jgi:hypothetical protein